MDSALERIALEAVDLADTAFQVTTGGDHAGLIASIRHLGVLSPPTVAATNGRLQVVSGFRRLSACRTAGLETVPVFRLPPDTPPFRRAEIAISENSLQRPLNIVEQSRAIRLLMRHAPSDSELAGAAARTGIGGSPRHWRQVARLCTMGDALQAGMVSGAIAWPVAVELERLGEGEALGLAHVLNRLAMSLSRQREFLNLVTEIALREELAPSSVLDAPDIRDVLAEDAGDGNVKARTLLEYLRRRRFPAITEAESRFRRHVRDLQLPEAVRLIAPGGFESPVYTLQIRFESPEDLERSAGELQTLANRPALRSLLNP